MPVAEFPGRSRLGLRRRRPLRAAPRLRRAGRAEAARRRVPRAGASAVVLDVVYNHLGPDGQLPRPVRPLLHRPLPDPVGRRRQLRRRRAATRCAASSSTTRCMWLARLPRRRAAPRRRARHRRHARRSTSSRSWPPRSTSSRPRWAGTLVPRSPRATSTTRGCVRAGERGGYGLDAQWSDDFHHALHVAAHRRARRATTRDFGGARRPGDGAAAGLRLRRPRTRRTAGDATAGPAGGLPATASSATRRTTTRSATGPPASGCRHLIEPDRRAASAAALVLTVAVRADAVPGRGVGRRRRRSSTSPTTPTPSWPRRSGPDARRSSADFVTDARTCPIRRMPPPSSARGWTGPSSRASHTPSLLAWHRTLLAFRRDHAAFLLRCASGRPIRRRRRVADRDLRGRRDRCVPLDRPASASLDAGRPWSVALASHDGVRIDDGVLCLPPWSFAALT